MTDSQVPGWLLLRPAAIVAAHPDDEVLGVGALLPRLSNLRAIIHVTDGAPRRGEDIANAGVATWQDYAALRRREVANAICRAGACRVRLISFACPDQEATLHIAHLATRLFKLFRHLRVELVFTHPYEGGHPDHDACAAAVRFACTMLRLERRHPEILEFTSYHKSASGGLESECFLGRSRKTWTVMLTQTQIESKRAALACFASQQRVLSQFPVCRESFRLAPDYEFRKPPHRGKLFYEYFDWGMTGRRWRKLVRKAIMQLHLAR